MSRLGYTSTPADPVLYLYTPPTDTWQTHSDPSGKLTGLHSPHVECFGSLAEQADLQTTGTPSNIEMIIQRPVTSIIIAGLSYYYYYLWAYHVPVEYVSFSYEAVVNRKELYRAITGGTVLYVVISLFAVLATAAQQAFFALIYITDVHAHTHRSTHTHAHALANT